MPSHIQPGSIVVATVRRSGMSVYDSIGLQDMTADDVYRTRSSGEPAPRRKRSAGAQR